MGGEWIVPATSFPNGFTGLLCLRAFLFHNVSYNYYGGCFRWTCGCGGTGKLIHASLVSAFSQFSTMDSARTLCPSSCSETKPNPVWLHVTNKPPLCVTHFHAENHVIQFPICKNPRYLSSWIISILILIPPQHWLLHPPSCPSVSLFVSGSDVTPNYSDSSPSNITMSLWCSCRGTGNQEPECDAFHRDFTHNTCLSESSVCLIPQCL